MLLRYTTLAHTHTYNHSVVYLVYLNTLSDSGYVDCCASSAFPPVVLINIRKQIYFFPTAFVEQSSLVESYKGNERVVGINHRENLQLFNYKIPLCLLCILFIYLYSHYLFTLMAFFF
uniref:Uncharacterized protein n=1 Tax=Sipha flava TaxID=143950 RepID=A0A2S2QLZ7_9HEMI